MAETGENGSVYGRVGVYFTGSDTIVRLDDPSTEAPGTRLDFENDLDFNKGSSVFEADLGVRLSDSWAIEFQYLSLDRRSSSIIDKTIEVDGEVFDVNAQIDSRFKSTVYHGKVVWQVADWDSGNFALTAGLHATDFAIILEGEAEAAGGGTKFVKVSEKALAPLPTLGARAQFDLTSDLRLFVQGEIFKLKIDNVKGDLIDAEAGLVWQISNNIGLGLSYRYLDYGLDIKQDNLLGSLDYTLSGPMGFVAFRF